VQEPSILVVDDDSDILEMANYFFKGAGVEVHCVDSGSQALEKIREKSYTVMLTDFNMPGMNGLELAEKAREIDPGMRIFLATGQPSRELSDLAAKVGITKMFAKPLRLEMLISLVKEVNLATFS